MPVTIDLKYLIDFLNELRAAGFDVSTQRYIAAQDLLIALAANGNLPEDPRSLRTLLGPVVCSSPREQENFYRYFDRWIKRNPQAAKPVQADVAVNTATEAPVKRRWTDLFRKPAFVAGSLVLLVGLIAGIAYVVSARTLTLTGSVVDADNNRPLSGATISYSQTTVSSDGDGKFAITYRKRDLPIAIDVESANYETGKEVIDANTTSPFAVRLVPVPTPTPTPAASPVPSVIPEATPRPTPLPSPVKIEVLPLPSEYVLETRRAWTGYGIAILPLFLFGGWWMWKLTFNRALLQKIQRVTEPRLEQLVVKGGASQLFQGPSFRRTIQELRRHRQRGASDLDAQRTVARTIQRGGLFTPAYGSRQTLPEYLVLIDRASFADQQARLDDEIVRRLVQDHVFVDTYHFQGDPRHCRKQDANSPYFSLHEISAVHPDHHLLIFSDGSSFINPLTGETERWVEMFSSWTSRALLTPESPAQWGDRERALAELDFIVLPATKEGLAALTELLGGGARVSLEADRRTRPYPSMLRDRTMRWLENHEPQPANLQRLCDQLKVFLGTKGYQWLSACAIYPMLYWDLTLYLGFKLFRDRSQIEDRLLSLVRLPWFRYGSIPDWLRLRLISDLSPKDEASVRKALEELLQTAMQQPADGIRLDIASEEKELGLRDRLKRRVRSWKFKRWFRQLAKDEPPESPLRDYVFLSFMSGRTPRKLTVSLPDSIQKFVFPEGQRALGLRPASLLAVAIAISLSLFVMSRYRTAAKQPNPDPPVFYVQMSAEQQKQFVKERAQEISARLGSGTTIISDRGLDTIKRYVDLYADRFGDSRPLAEVFGRAVPFAPTINQAFQNQNLPPILGLYLAMINSEYYFSGHYDLFGQGTGVENSYKLSRSAEWAAEREASCARVFGSDSAGMIFVIQCFHIEPNEMRTVLGLMKEDPNPWSLLDKVYYTAQLASNRVPEFFAAAIVGENPRRFRMNMEPLSSYLPAPATPEFKKIPSLIAQFTGDNRRNASDQLVGMYSQNKTGVVEALINAILSSGPDSYRVNLYIARTLGLIEPNWEGTSDQFQKLTELRDTPDYKDKTFRTWVDQAIARYVTNAPNVKSLPSPSPSPRLAGARRPSTRPKPKDEPTSLVP
ncbi:MAG TPA: hypothetical protein VF290_20705 [Pyrinomonadaceae bacterium]